MHSSTKQKAIKLSHAAQITVGWGMSPIIVVIPSMSEPSPQRIIYTIYIIAVFAVFVVFNEGEDRAY
ncbi:MAG: hypothetical protein ABF680_15385, partial [Acetobacter persici]